MTPILAQYAFGGAGGAAFISMLAVMLLLAAIPAILAYLILKRVPPAYRKQDPALSFLLLIPFFSLVWAFFVHPRVAASLKAYFDAQGAHEHGDCGATLALWSCILAVCSLIPLLGMLAGLSSLVLLIVFYVKAFEFSKNLPTII
jgi:hypothetical protein